MVDWGVGYGLSDLIRDHSAVSCNSSWCTSICMQSGLS